MSNKDYKKDYSRKSIITIMIFSIILWFILSSILLIIDPKLLISITFHYRCIFVLFCLLNLCALLQWWVLRKIFFKTITERINTKSTTGKHSSKKNKSNKDLYLFSYILSALQRKGRFMDFLSEDISSYEDTQIGTVIRTMHKDWGKTVNYHFDIEHIMLKNEGEKTKVLSGFDANAVSLVGNVVGTPPFDGIVKHRGWKLKVKRLPKFKREKNDSNIIYPAQIAIL